MVRVGFKLIMSNGSKPQTVIVFVDIPDNCSMHEATEIAKEKAVKSFADYTYVVDYMYLGLEETIHIVE